MSHAIAGNGDMVLDREEREANAVEVLAEYVGHMEACRYTMKATTQEMAVHFALYVANGMKPLEACGYPKPELDTHTLITAKLDTGHWLLGELVFSWDGYANHPIRISHRDPTTLVWQQTTTIDPPPPGSWRGTLAAFTARVREWIATQEARAERGS